MPQAKNHLTASTQAKNGSLYAVIQYKDKNGKRKNKWKSLGLKEGASKAKINAAMREAVNDFEKELTEILTRSQNPDADMPVFEYMVKWARQCSTEPANQHLSQLPQHDLRQNQTLLQSEIYHHRKPAPESDRRILSVHLR